MIIRFIVNEPHQHHLGLRLDLRQPGELVRDTTIQKQGCLTGTAYGRVDLGGGPLPPHEQRHVFAAKLDMNGGHIWSTSIAGERLVRVEAATVDAEGNLYVLVLASKRERKPFKQTTRAVSGQQGYP